jgi:NADH dehydrogenase/NADH:ubiquinone oxidoreductase subunit G
MLDVLPLIGAGLGGLGGVIGSAIGASGASSAQDEANRAAAAEAEKNREFQKWMSNTAVQRYAADLEDAGFNRILAAGGGQSSTPSGSVAPVGAVNKSAGVAAGFSSALSSAQAITSMAAQQAAATQSLNAAEASLASAKNAEADRPRIEAEARLAARMAGAKVTQAEARAAREAYDRKYIELDSNIERGSKLLNAGSAALDLGSSALGVGRAAKQVDKLLKGSMRNRVTGKERDIYFKEIP